MRNHAASVSSACGSFFFNVLPVTWTRETLLLQFSALVFYIYIYIHTYIHTYIYILYILRVCVCLCVCLSLSLSLSLCLRACVWRLQDYDRFVRRKFSKFIYIHCPSIFTKYSQTFEKFIQACERSLTKDGEGDVQFFFL
jgi:hypothetical protein